MNRLFGGGKEGGKSALPIVDEEADALWEQAIAETEAEEEALASDLVPGERRVISAPVLSGSPTMEASEEVVIVAQPASIGDQCVFKVNRVLMENCSWHFAGVEEATGSPLVESLFALGEVETVLVCESMIVATARDAPLADWEPLARKIGATLRATLEADGVMISPEVFEKIPAEEEIQANIQRVIDEVVNPGVAGHGGNISIIEVRGNSVTIKMGGGCQGCSAADMTLKQGIHTSFRDAVSGVGAIFDETDHSAGLNPYFS